MGNEKVGMRKLDQCEMASVVGARSRVCTVNKLNGQMLAGVAAAAGISAVVFPPAAVPFACIAGSAAALNLINGWVGAWKRR